MNSSVSEEGFLSDETAGVEQAGRTSIRTWLALFCSVNARAVKAQYEA